MAALVVSALLSLGCAAGTGWERSAARACDPAGPPRVCVVAQPDRALVVRAGGSALVPGECVRSPRARGGALRVTAEDGRTGTAGTRWVRTGKGKTARVGVTAKGRPFVAARDRCTGQVETDMLE